jgi:ABC-type glutathione transport system ATPase component
MGWARTYSTQLIGNQQPEISNSIMNNGSDPLIRLNSVTKVFLTDEVETHALSGIHLDIRPGEYVSIAGPSGCGKTTLLSILGLLDTPSDGSYSLKGHEVANLSFADRARIRNREIGFIFQSFNLIGDLSVFENVSPKLWSAWAWRIGQSICQVSSPAANSNAWLSPGPLRVGRPFCWQTNRRAILIRATVKR